MDEKLFREKLLKILVEIEMTLIGIFCALSFIGGVLLAINIGLFKRLL